MSPKNDTVRHYRMGVRVIKVGGGMEKKWDTVTPADLKRVFVSGTCMYR